MISRIIVLFIAVMGLAHSSIAQLTKQIKVVEQNTQKPIPQCTILFPELHTGTVTDKQGIFQIKEIVSNAIEVQISKLGYELKLFRIELYNIEDTILELERTHIQMQEVVISVPKGRLQSESITPISRKSIKELQSTAPTSLTDALTSIAGVEQQSTGTRIGKPIIRGLTGNRIVTYAQDIRVENQQWGDEHGLGIGELGIEGVEIIKGPSSLLYGSDALGGVIYFVEERYAKHNTMEGYWQSGFQSNNLSFSNTAAMKINKNRLKLNVFGNYSSAIDYQVPNALRVNNSRWNEVNFKSALGYSSKNWIGNLRYAFIQNNFGITEDSSLTENTARDITVPYQNISNHSLSLQNIFYSRGSTLQFTVGYSHNDRKEYEMNPDTALLSMNLHTWTYHIKWTKPFFKDRLHIIIGSQGMTQSNKNSGFESLIPNATTNDLGMYAMGIVKWKDFTIQGGLRLDHRRLKCEELYEDTVLKFATIDRDFVNPNFSLGANYHKKNIRIRTNISNGFRSPNTSELASNGQHEGTNRYEIGNSSIKIESALQLDVSMDYTNDHFQFSINPFINKLDNYIYLAPTQQTIDNSPVYVFNQKNAFLYGGEMGFHYHPHNIHWLHLESNLSTIYAQDENGDALPLIPATRIHSTIKVETKSFVKAIFINHIYKFSQNRVSEFETTTPSYHLFHAGIQMDLPLNHQHIKWSIVARNIFNLNYIDHLSRFKSMGIPNQGFNIALQFKIDLSKPLP